MPTVCTRRLTWLTAAVTLVASIAVVPGVAGAEPPHSDPRPSSTDTIPGRIVISWDRGATASQRADVRHGHGLRTEETFDAIGIEVVSVPPHATDRVIAALQNAPGVAVAEPDHVMEAGTNDPGYTYLWGLHNTGQDGGTVDIDIDAPEAWQITRGKAEVIVAVIDTGIDISHPDLAGNIWKNPGEIAGNGIDDDGNGYIDDVNGWDFYNGDNTVFDSVSDDAHGTHIAGTVAAIADNGIGVVGVAPNVTIMPVKFLGGPDGTGSSSAAAAAVNYAYENGATVINASWGGTGGTALKNAITSATGAVVVAGAGNFSEDMDTGTRQFPAAWADDAYDVPNVLSVTSVDNRGRLSSFANHGAATVDVGAPGEDIVSTVPGGLYGYLSGTSMASPFAAGAAALVASLAPSLTGAQLVTALKGGAQPLSSLDGKTSTGGLLNAHASLSLQASGTQPEPEPEPEGPAPYDGDGARSLEQACPGITESGFSDVPTSSIHAPGVGCARAWEVFTGSADGLFGPNTNLTRGQLASVLARAIEQALGHPLPAGRDHFTDDDDSVHRVAIDKLAEAKIVTGLTATTYGPSAPVTRGQFATMLARTYRHLAGSLPTGSDTFTDDDGSIHEPAINGLAALGIVAGTGDGLYRPGTTLVRAQSATLVARLLDALVEAEVVAGLDSGSG